MPVIPHDEYQEHGGDKGGPWKIRTGRVPFFCTREIFGRKGPQYPLPKMDQCWMGQWEPSPLSGTLPLAM